ncbi:MAG TPA: NADH-quinone oxidoreductase subunit N [Terriglobales bacterium]
MSPAIPASFVPGVYYLRILPEIVLSVFALLIMLIEGPAKAISTGSSRARLSACVAFIGCLVALATVWVQAANAGDAFSGMFRVDAFTIFMHILLIAATAVIVLLAMDYLPQQGLDRGEFYALLLFATVGMGFMAGSVELIMIFIGLEISSIATYVLCGYRRHNAQSTEASLKYFLLGSFATAFFLYGIALLYGASGTTNLYVMAAHGFTVSPGGISHAALVLAAAGLIFIGLGFKVSAAPFQMWTPDVYEGAPALVTGFMSAGPKAAAFAVALRIFYVALQGSSASWFWLFWTAAILSMCIGNLGALYQKNLKRMLAYSSIAQAGYVLVAFTALGPGGASAVLFYLAAYVAMNIGAFAVISHWAHREEAYVNLKDYAGLGFRFPWLGFCLSMFLFSLIGVPMTGGFFGKLFVFRTALDAHLIGLTVIALLNSALAAFYYLRVIVYMYMRPQEGEPIACARNTAPLWLALASCLGVTLWLGIFPNQALQYALKGAQQLLR